MDLVLVFVLTFLAASLGARWIHTGSRVHILYSGVLCLAITWAFDRIGWAPIANESGSISEAAITFTGIFFLGCLAAAMFGFLERSYQKKHGSDTPPTD